MIAIGKDKFEYIMGNEATIEGKIDKAICGIPANFLFLTIVLVMNLILKHRKQKRMLANSQKESTEKTA